MPKFFAFINIADMDLDHWRFNTRYSITNSHRSMRIGACINYNTVAAKAHFVQFINNFTFYVTLIIIYGDVCIAFAEVDKIVLKTAVAINRFFANAKQI